ncbi:MAG TPA: CPBP family intramembrane glutamic endopeptidase [Cellvibrio sp.]|nr:CPBP family intramembrane glutamic endopeptidase [Cellvibrio sp.]
MVSSPQGSTLPGSNPDITAPGSTFLRSHWFWVIFLGLSVFAGIAALKLMFSAAPGLSLDIRFSREQAVAAAKAFQQQQFPALQTDRSAAVFVSDRHFQNYVELEAGGVKAFEALMPQLDAVTHYWKVRHFAAGQEQELITAFSPRGEPISFSYKIPEKDAGAALDESAARTIAEEGARAFMGERFAAYNRFETKQQRQASGRVDYSFTYEHASLKVGEARFRLDIKVAGDKLVAIDTFKHVPDAFDQRFGEMRSLNTQISQIASYLMAVLFGLGGLVGGGVWLFRRHQLHWRRAFWPAAVVAAGLAGATLCNLPVAWMDYQTTSPAQTFLIQQLAQAGAILIGASLFFATIYAVAEGLTRMAFTDHPRIFDFFRLSSPASWGRVLGGYAWTGLFLLYAVAFYLFSSKVLGWWQPTDINSDPNILASWRPALAPIFTALQAGTWEECLFRAIPLALAVLIGNHFGIRNKLVIVTLIVQALIFAGAHANYPNLPGYSRLIELFIPAIAFGLVYLRFGLVICMITHFEYDLVLMSLPIFTAEDSSLWIDRLLVIVAGVAPLLALLWAQVRKRKFVSSESQWRNGVPLDPVPDAQALQQEEVPVAGNELVIRPLWLVAIAVIALIVIGISALKPPKLDWPEYQIDRAGAQLRAEEELSKHGVVLEGEWHRTATTNGGWYQPLDFVWRESGREQAQSLIGNYLDTPFWLVTWRKFDGPVENRSERWRAWLYPDGRLRELVHDLPEGESGAKLTREQAVSKAMEQITQLGWGDLSTLEEKSVEEALRPARSDWTVTYIDKAAYNHNDGQAKITIRLAGDEVVGYARSIDVPEAWSRAESEDASRKQPYKIIAMVAFFALLGCAATGLIRKHSGRKFNFQAALPWVVIAASANFVVTLLWIDPALSSLQTTMGWWIQVGMLLVGAAIASSVLGLLAFFAAQMLHAERPRAGANANRDFLVGAILALGLMGCYSLLELVNPSTAAPGPYSADFATIAPWLTTLLNGLKGVFPALMLLILAIGLIRYTTKTWRWLLVVLLSLVWWIGGALAARDFSVVLGTQFLTLLQMLLVFELIRRQQTGVAIAVFGAGIALRQLAVMEAIYPQAWLHGLISAVSCLAIAYLLVKHWYRQAVK